MMSVIDYLFVFVRAVFVAPRPDKLDPATNGTCFKGVPEVIKNYFLTFKATYMVQM